MIVSMIQAHRHARGPKTYWMQADSAISQFCRVLCMPWYGQLVESTSVSTCRPLQLVPYLSELQGLQELLQHT